MRRPKVLLVVDDGELRARYELVLRFCGFDPVAKSRHDVETLDEAPHGFAAACVLSDHGPNVEKLASRFLASTIPVVRIDPFIRHTREHLPFEVELPASSEPRELISALRHLMPHARPS